eukprot:4000554-Pyramimonas_sp.AAC.1
MVTMRQFFLRLRLARKRARARDGGRVWAVDLRCRPRRNLRGHAGAPVALGGGFGDGGEGRRGRGSGRPRLQLPR